MKDFIRRHLKLMIILLIIIIAIIVVIIVRSKKKIKLEEYVIPEYNYFAMYSLDEKVGVVDKNGKLIIEATYSDIFIPNPSKDRFACYEGDTYKFIDSSGKELFKDYEDVSMLQTSEMNLDFEKNLLRFKKDGLYGLIDYDGNVVTSANYDSLESLKYKPGEILAQKEGKYGVIGSDGKIKIDIKYDSVMGDEYFTEKYGYAQAGYIVGMKSSNGFIYGYLDSNGEEILDKKFESISRVSKYNTPDYYLIVMNNGKKGVYKNNKELIEQKYQSINYTDNSGLFVVKRNSKYGIFASNGKEVLAVKYVAYNLAGDYISVESENGKKELYDINGNKISNLNYKSVQASRRLK